MNFHNMDFESLARRVNYPKNSFDILKPSVSLWLTYSEPIQTLGSHIADLFEAFRAFIGHDKLTGYLSGNGSWKPLSPRVLKRDIAELRAIPSHYEAVEYHYEGNHLGSVSDFGFHFFGSHLKHKLFPLQENLIVLQFPVNLLKEKSPHEFINFVSQIASSRPFGSGTAGYGFHHLYLTHREEALPHVGRLSLRYLGFDINSDDARRASRGRIYNVSWLTLLSSDIIAALGGEPDLIARLPEGINIIRLNTGLLLQLGALPAIGDINQGAEDINLYKVVAALTKPLRINAQSVKPTLDCTPQWLARLDI